MGDLIEHETPVVPAKPSADAKPVSPPAVPSVPNAATKAEGAANEAANILSEQSRKHLFEGEINKKRGKATGWHYEPTGNREKGTYVLEETRSPPDAHGVYAANVVIEGTKKKARSTFFPKEWTKEQVSSAIDEAYQSKKRNEATGLYIGKSEVGVEIEMMLNPKGGIQRVNPVYKGPKYEGPKK